MPSAQWVNLQGYFSVGLAQRPPCLDRGRITARRCRDALLQNARIAGPVLMLWCGMDGGHREWLRWMSGEDVRV